MKTFELLAVSGAWSFLAVRGVEAKLEAPSVGCALVAMAFLFFATAHAARRGP